MRIEDRQGLLLRQVAALRRGGLPHDQALRQAAACLPVGELRAEVQRSLRALEAGAAPGAAPSSLEALLAEGAADPTRLEQAAQTIEAGHQARAAIATARLYLGLAAAAALGFTLLVTWLSTLDMAAALGLGWHQPPHAWVHPLLRWGALAVAITAVAVASQAHRLAPGRLTALRAQALWAAAARGADAPPPGLDPNELHYYAARRAQTDATVAAGELAEELLIRSRRAQALLRFLAPLASAALLLPALGVAGFMLVAPLFGFLTQMWVP